MAHKYEIGSGSRCIAGIQSAYDSEATTFSLLNMRSESINVSVSKSSEENLLELKATGGVELESISVAGSVSTYLRPEFVDWLLEATLGKAGVDGVYTLADPDEDVIFSTVYLERGEECKKYKNMAVSSLSLSCDAQKTVGADIAFIGQKEEDGTMASVANYVKKSYKCTSAYLKYATSGSEPTKELPVETLSLSISNGLNEGPRTYLSTLYAEEPSRGLRTVTLNFTLPKGEDYNTLKSTYLEADLYVAFELHFTNGEEGESITVSLPNVSLTSGSANVNGTGIINGSLSGTAVQVGDDEPITVRVVHSA